MKRVILKASDGMVYTDGLSGGKTVYLGEGQSADGWQEVPEQVFYAAVERGETLTDATQADYENALREFGVKL